MYMHKICCNILHMTKFRKIKSFRKIFQWPNTYEILLRTKYNNRKLEIQQQNTTITSNIPIENFLQFLRIESRFLQSYRFGES